MKHPFPRLAALLLLLAAGLAGACTEQLPSDGMLAPEGPRLTRTPTNAFTNFDAGYDHTCGLTSGGSVWCWGRNAQGQLGDSSAASTLVPVQVFQATDTTFNCYFDEDFNWVCDQVVNNVAFTQITAGEFHTCGINSAGKAWCWGSNGDGRVGDGTWFIRTAPTKVAGTHAFTQIGAGIHTCGVTSAGQAYCWGGNNWGQLGDSTVSYRNSPVAVKQPAGVTFTHVAPGNNFTCALTSGGQAYCWGYAAQGGLGNNSISTQRTPVAVQQPVGVTFTSISSEYQHACGLTSGGQAYCWGYNASGQVGDSTITNAMTPKAVMQPAGVTFVGIATGASHTCGVTSAGQTYCWGSNANRQFGNGTTTSSRIPVPVSQPIGVTYGTMRTGGFQTYGMDSGGQVYANGHNNYGQMGDNTTTNRATPVEVLH